jgi:hypothetical protein
MGRFGDSGRGLPSGDMRGGRVRVIGLEGGTDS